MMQHPAPVLVALALLGLSACFDPMVGGECKPGYSPCHGVCLPTGICQTLDASTEAGLVDGSEGETSVGTDADEIDAGGGVADDGGTTDEAGAAIDASAIDGGQGETEGDDANQDVPGLVDGDFQPDVPDIDDVPLSDDLPGSKDVAPILAVDADESLDGGSDGDESDGDAEDGEGATEAGEMDGGDDTGTTDDAADDGGTSDDDAATDDAGDDGVTPLVCTDPQIICNDQCVDPTLDPENCGDCNTICETGVCIDRVCLVCATEETVCGRQCLNLSTDPDNCGGCDVPCMSGLCSNGQCEAAGTGRAIVIGHDYYKNRPAMNRILGNAVFLWPVNPVRLVVYEGAADQTAINGANGAITQVATATGRLYDLKVVSATEVPSALAAADVFLIYGQQGASNEDLLQLGQDWKAALTPFLQTGGTVILLDGDYDPQNAGTSQILSQAGLFDLARDALATNHVCTVIARGDALASGLPRTYLCEKNSTSFVVNDTATTITPVVADGTHTVVVHKIF
jgi:hypothetical protein